MNTTLRFIAVALLLFPLTALAQIVTGKVVDANQQPVPYASVQIGPLYGVVTNTEGDFVIDKKDKTDADKVIFSSIGFETLTIKLSELKNGTYTLKEQVNVLDEVFITNKKYTPTELLTKVMENASKNYPSETAKQTVFLRTSNETKLLDSKFELIKSSLEKKSVLKDINKEIEVMNNSAKKRTSQDYSEVYGYLYTQNNQSKLDVEKAIELKNKDKDVSGDQLNGKAMEVIKKHLDPTATYKVRSGIIPISDTFKIDSPKSDIKTDVKTASLRTTLTSLSNTLNKFYTNEDLDFFTEFKRYTYTLEGYSTYNDETIYIIDFKPAKGSAHYYGKIYVNAFDFAVVKLDYNLVDGENEHKINLKLLLGVKMVQDRTKVSATYAKNEAGQYAVNFVKKQTGTYMYIDRSMKFTQNKKTKDEEERMLKLGLMAEMDQITTNELFVIAKTPISAEAYTAITEKPKYNINYIAKYDPSIWKDYNVLAPVDAIKNYK
ncbi:carboxypeptidase-like regulatory domain-containing protein [Flavobacterium psychrotrophum]|uniref:carboxypeptidase-like regulatory domain-containing protein n=1 Tax=Flavobacterium psychrotrophum TaxID=2294119 RepID=UPI000E311DB9|nr:carboxypeptidase-like regulatory domain-containing protein [Flavobacterium psychrotrophum]